MIVSMNLFDPFNTIFLLSLTIGIFFMLITAVGGIGDGSDHDHGTDHDHDAGHDHDHDDAVVGRALSFLGVGRMPLMLVLTMQALLFGGIGFILNLVFTHFGLSPGVGGSIAFFAAGASSIALVRLTGKVFVKIMPKTESYDTTNEELCGCRGTAVFTVTSTEGAVQVRDLQDNLQKVSARTKNGETIPRGGAVEILSYQDGGDYFIVTQVDARSE